MKSSPTAIIVLGLLLLNNQVWAQSNSVQPTQQPITYPSESSSNSAQVDSSRVSDSLAKWAEGEARNMLSYQAKEDQAQKKEDHLPQSIASASSIADSASLNLALLRELINLSNDVKQLLSFQIYQENARNISRIKASDISIPTVSNWFANAVTGAMTFDFVNYRKEFMLSRDSFTNEGWQTFETALKDSGNLKAVIDNKYVTSAVPTGTPALVDSGKLEDGWAWKFQMPMIVTYQSSNNKTTQSILVTGVVKRVEEAGARNRLRIVNLTME